MQPVQTLILLAVIANLAVMAGVLLPALMARRGPMTRAGDVTAADGDRAAAAAVLGDGELEIDPTGVPAGAYDRVVRIVSWVFILAASTIDHPIL